MVTGGYITQSPSTLPRSASDVLSLVTQYSEAGFYKDLAPLNQRRFNHACAKFVDESGNTVCYQILKSHLYTMLCFVGSTSNWR